MLLHLFVVSVYVPSVASLVCDGTVHVDDSTKQDTVCPTWFTPIYQENKSMIVSCRCYDSIQERSIVRCPSKREVCPDSMEKNGYDTLNVSIITSFCMTHNFTTHQTTLGACIYNEHALNDENAVFFVKIPSNILELNSFMCSHLRREGELCNRCINGTGVSINAAPGHCFNVTNSSNNLSWFFALELCPPAIFLALVIICKFRATSGPLNAFLVFSQMFTVIINLQRSAFSQAFNTQSINLSRRLSLADWRSVAIEIVSFTYTFWYNQYVWAVSFSISPHISQIEFKALEYFSALYPLFIIILLFICIKLYNSDRKFLIYIWMPIRYCLHQFRRGWDPMSSIMHAFSTFLMLSYTKVVVVSFQLMIPSRVYNQTGELPYKILSYDASIHFLSRQHLPYFLLGLCMLTLFCCIPVLMFVYPMRCFQELLGKKPFNRVNWLPLHTFCDSFMGCFKDREGPEKRECRYFASFYFMCRVIYTLCLFILQVSHVWIALIVLPIICSLLFAILQPYKNKWLNIIDCSMFFVFALITILFMCNIYIFRSSQWIANSLLILPFLYFITFVAYKVISKVRFCFLRIYMRYFNRYEHLQNSLEEESFNREGEEQHSVNII